MANLIDKVRVVAGRLIRVENTQRKQLAAHSPLRTGAEYYYSVWVEDADGSNERCLLLTACELERIERRSRKNPEDLPAKGLIARLLD